MRSHAPMNTATGYEGRRIDAKIDVISLHLTRAKLAKEKKYYGSIKVYFAEICRFLKLYPSTNPNITTDAERTAVYIAQLGLSGQLYLKTANDVEIFYRHIKAKEYEQALEFAKAEGLGKTFTNEARRAVNALGMKAVDEFSRLKVN